jgi:hypothetical protein
VVVVVVVMVVVGILTPIPPRLQTIIHILVILILLHAHDDQVGEVAVHLDLLLLQHGVLGRFCAAGQHHACAARLDGAAGDLVCFGPARGGELGVERGVFFLRRVEGVGEFLVVGRERGVCFGEGGDGFVERGDFGGARLEVGDLVLEGFDYCVLVCRCVSLS